MLSAKNYAETVVPDHREVLIPFFSNLFNQGKVMHILMEYDDIIHNAEFIVELSDVKK